ncbi:MAG: alanine racemase [Candidatus Omnitrophica bacterium]|jgi:alanine racemase|nr:alanine racemase [Candidatus Omnitrophota bacterium]MDD5661386.1 alanine racemase [Candidatus Omnitrophota bacterium]
MPNTDKIGYRPTWAEVNLNNLEHNLRQVKAFLPLGIKVLVTVKADAYGHGIVAVSKKLSACGVDYLGVASIDEGIKLRRAGIKTPILLLGLILKKDIQPVFTYALTPTICDKEMAVVLNAKACALRKPIRLHIKVDTGMGRIGILHDDAFKLVKDIYKLKNVIIEGLFTHFAFADLNRKFTSYQISLFKKLVSELRGSGIIIPLVHAANSIGLIDYKDSHFTMVRPGLVIYGLHPKEGLDINLRQVLTLKSRIIFIKDVPAGYGISYGRTYITNRLTRIITLPIGYGDGYPRNLSNLAPVLIAGKRFRICGKICMDQIMVDVGKLKPKIGDEVVLIGSQGSQRITAEELADLSGTIPYEIVCGLGSRIPRVYKDRVKRVKGV